MNCRDCQRFDPTHQACLDGKINPPRYTQALEAAQIFGLRAICPLNDHRERLVAVRQNPLVRPPSKKPSNNPRGQIT